MKNRSLKKQIEIFLVLFIMTMIVTVGTLSIISIYNSKTELIKYNQKLILEQVNNKIDSTVNKIDYLGKYISKKYTQENSQIALESILDTNKEISTILILNKNGILENFFTKLEHNRNIYKGFDFSNKEYFRKLENRGDYWSNVFLSSVNEIPTISYSFNMKDKVCVMLINLSEISEFVKNFRNQDESFMVRVFDRNAVLVINPQFHDYVLQRYNASSTEIFTKLINENKPLDSVVYYSVMENENQFGTYIKNKITGWNIIVRENYNNILISLNNLVITYILLILLFMAVAIFFTLKISKKVFTSFDKMHRITSKIASGNYDAKVENIDFKEFNRLLKSFYKMQEEIDKREECLEKSLNSFKSLFNSTMECVVLSKGFEIVDVNDVTVKLFGFKSKEDALSKSIFDYIVDDYKDLVRENFKKNIVSPYEVEFKKENGDIFHSLVQGKYLELNGEMVRVSALIDITELKNKDQLLFQQTKMASMGEMIGNIAHQWRQPLNVITTSASSIKLEREFGILKEDQIDDSMDMIVQNALYLSKTIDDFRNFFKIDKDLELFEVKVVVEKALKLLDSTISNNEIKVVTKFLDKRYNIEGYPNEFIQVIINIINNSKDAFIMNDVKTKVIEIKEELNKDSYKLMITDNAGGIPENIIYKVFDPYFTTKHKSQGTGIGLYMSHQIITDHMKGEFFVNNVNYKYEEEQYKGCCFTIKLSNKTVHNYIFEI